MVRTASCFAQALSLINRYEFARLVTEHRADRRTKGFSCWDQFVAMLFCQMAAANTLREICYGLATALGKLVHLGLNEAPKRSTLAYANEHRPWQLYRGVFEHVLGRCQTLAASKKLKFRFKNPLRSLDATVIDLCLEMFDWARFRRAKGAIKLHMQLDHRGYLPCWAWLTEGKTHEVTVARRLSFDPGTIVVMDMAYTDYRMFAAWTEAEVLFVTRMKDNAVYRVRERRRDSEKGLILRDQIIRLTGARAADKCPHDLRRVVVWDEEHEREIVLLTNIFHLSARTIAAIYKERWQIETFFKALKQNLKVKTFVGTSENAVQIQIWTALIAMLLLKFMQLKSSWHWSLSNLAAMVRMNLLTYRDLWLWLDNPFPLADQQPEETQLLLWQ